MERQFKVVRADRTGGSAIMIEEAEELTKVNAELVGADCVTEDEIIEAAKDADVILTGGSSNNTPGYGGVTKMQGNHRR